MQRAFAQKMNAADLVIPDIRWTINALGLVDDILHILMQNIASTQPAGDGSGPGLVGAARGH
jgi:hypothetical protein